MKWILVLFLTIGFFGNAAIDRRSRDLRLPQQQMLERDVWIDPVAATTASILSANAGNTSAAAATVSTFLAQPDYARALVITPGGTTNDVAACDVSVTGKDINGDTITETFPFADNASTATTGSRAFKTISSVTFPANCEDGTFAATWSIGVSEKLGLKRCMNVAGDVAWAVANSAFEATRPTVAASSTSVSQNTVDFNTALNGSLDTHVYYVQNFRCLN